ncbi:30S ribosomal protein S21 [Candidatus Tremblaya phenacola PAVE]|nr:30S ribosomal protein S21 [Candidatus Tremblaya phenacola PAVE]
MGSVIPRENESFEVVLRRFRRTVERGGLLAEVRRRTFFEKPTAKRKRRVLANKRRHSDPRQKR